MTNTKTQTTTIQVGEFIHVPAWQAQGQVIAVESARYGSDNAQRVLLQETPEDETGRWYTLEPNEFTFV